MTRGCATYRVLASLLFTLAGAHADSIISNGNFQQGLSGWTTFTTSNGTAGMFNPQVAAFSPAVSDTEDAVQFEVGQSVRTNNVDMEGAGIMQTVIVPGGQIQLSVDIAAQGSTSANLFGGFAQLLIDMQPVAGYDLGALNAGQIQLAVLSVQEVMEAGAHSIGIEFLRQATADYSTPYQYVYNFEGDDMAPEPSTIVLMALPLLFVFWRVRRASVKAACDRSAN